jgi:hypothetical protein
MMKVLAFLIIHVVRISDSFCFVQPFYSIFICRRFVLPTPRLQHRRAEMLMVKRHVFMFQQNRVKHLNVPRQDLLSVRFYDLKFFA